jgi:hypothetical protein
LIEEDSGDDALDRFVDGGVVEYDICALTAEFECDARLGIT